MTIKVLGGLLPSQRLEQQSVHKGNNQGGSRSLWASSGTVTVLRSTVTQEAAVSTLRSTKGSPVARDRVRTEGEARALAKELAENLRESGHEGINLTTSNFNASRQVE